MSEDQTLGAVVLVFRFVSVGTMIVLFSISLCFICKAKYGDVFEGLPVSAILIAASTFLSIRYPTEQRVVWLVLFLAITSSAGYLSEKVFWALSTVAFLYMQKSFPQCLLPVATVNVDVLLPLFSVYVTV